ncbi:uncharacterized protein BX663DRAFT_444931 [Cokeromyces recurvatus]|uniref:uncharacterized protein n=1 Tax=Cokeromyces recurvatus TaxID=90255 RepID=UPI0022211EE3|nr:uncharacterized protein BX663DRAFT_444931 [Cokeromyces recurvatus]KAI7897532.1 hypothetical protein BX663DRAFT_444931 [Cokeromyces recurvatus]
MSFFGDGNSDCGPVNPMAGLMKQFGRDRSLQQDRLNVEQKGESSKVGFRARNRMNSPISNDQLTDEFFREEKSRMETNTFQFKGLNRELELIGQQPIQNWTADFIQHQQEPQQFDEFEKIYQQNRQYPIIQGVDWHKEFEAFQAIHSGETLTQTERDAFEKTFEEAKHATQKTMNWEQEFTTQQESWANEFEQQEEQSMTSKDENEALAKTAALLLDSVDIESNPKFKNSQFMNLMRKLKDSEVQIEGNKMVETRTSTQLNNQNTNDWASEFTQHVGSTSSGNMWSTEFAAKAERSWASEFHYEQNQHQQPGDWASEFSKHQSEKEEMEKLFGRGTETDDWVQQYNKNIAHLKTAQDQEWEALQKDWEQFNPEQGIGYRATNSEYNTYHFALNNPFLLDHEAIQQVDHRNLADSILALEARAQLETSNSDAWKMLGLRQQENERDVAAIAALRKAVSINPRLLDAWLALAVSYTNENCRVDAYDALEQWIMNHDQYKHLIKTAGKTKMTRPEDRHGYITHMFLEAARSAPGQEMDADVQVGLGVLFNVSEEYDKAIDCFKAALAINPQDYLLWNKLGATLANSRDSSGAIEAYFNALTISPTYVRARYNLAISCINLGEHREAAEHLLTALAIQKSNDNGSIIMNEDGNKIPVYGGMSDNVWGSLRMLMLNMHREDLVKACDDHNLDAFRSEFDF